MLNLATFTSFIILNAVLFLSSVFFIFFITGYRISDFIKLLLSAFTVYLSLILIIEILLGVFNSISYTNISIFVYVIFFISSILFFINKSKVQIEKLEPERISTLIFFAIFTPLIFILVVRAFNALLQIPFEYDNVAYHLPFTVEWLNLGSLNQLYYSAFASPLAYYPSNYELLDLWAILPFRNDFLINLLNFPLFIVFGTVLYKIFRNFSISKNITLISIALLFYMPVILRQAGLPLVDLFFCLTFALSIYFLQEIVKNKTNENIILFALSMGLFIGTKYLGIVMAPPLILILLWILITQKIKKFLLIKQLLLIIIGIFLTGSFFYIRNWVDSGNPLFPVDVNLGGIQIFEGYNGMNDRLTTTSLLANIGEPQKLDEFFNKYFLMTGFASLLIAVSFIFIFAYIIYNFLTITKNKQKTDLVISLLLFLGGLIYLYLYIKSPYSYRDLIPNVRYSMPFLILGIISAGFIVSRLKFLQAGFYPVSFFVIIYSIIFLIFNPSPDLYNNDRILLDFSIINKYKMLFLYLLVFLIILFYGFKFLLNRKPKWKVYSGIFLTALSVLFFMKIMTIGYIERENLIKYFYSSWYVRNPELIGLMDVSLWFNNNEPNAKIAYSGFNFHYHLFGRDLSRDVDYVNINDCLKCRYVDYKNAPQSIRTNPNFDDWMYNLKSEDKEFLVIQPGFMADVKSYEFEWAQQNPKIFKKVFESNETYIYKIN